MLCFSVSFPCHVLYCVLVIFSVLCNLSCPVFPGYEYATRLQLLPMFSMINRFATDDCKLDGQAFFSFFVLVYTLKNGILSQNAT